MIYHVFRHRGRWQIKVAFEGWRMDDRREFERIVCAEIVLCQRSAEKHQVTIANISLGGCFIESNLSVHEGEIIVIELSMEHNQKVFFSGKVQHKKDGLGFGMKFSYMPESKQALLTNFIESLRNKKS
jgi:hypothetical protein